MTRYSLLDTIRGITIISMILFHTCWDLMYFGLFVSAEFLYGRVGYIWQQSICHTFILLSGFSFSFGRHHIRRGLMALGGGIIITIVTILIIPDERDIFGVLWLIGISTLIMALFADAICKKKSEDRPSKAREKDAISENQRKTPKIAIIGAIASFTIFFITRNINHGYLGFEGINFIKLPENLYKGYFMTLVGFTDPGFYSSDYFSIIPWFFLFTTGFFLNKILFGTTQGRAFADKYFIKGIRPLSFLGRHSLIIYMLHQVVIYGVIYALWYMVFKG